MKHSKQKLQGVAVSAAESERGREYLLSSELKLSAVLTKCTKETERLTRPEVTRSRALRILQVLSFWDVILYP